MMTMAEPVNKTAWPMFTIVDSQKRCKELMVPVLIDGKSVDLELDTGAFVTIIPNHVWSGVLAATSLQQTDVKLKSYSGHEIPVLGEGKSRCRMVINKPASQLLSLPVMVQHLWDEIGCPFLDLTGSRSSRFPWNRTTK